MFIQPGIRDDLKRPPGVRPAPNIEKTNINKNYTNSVLEVLLKGFVFYIICYILQVICLRFPKIQHMTFKVVFPFFLFICLLMYLFIYLYIFSLSRKLWLDKKMSH